MDGKKQDQERIAFALAGDGKRDPVVVKRQERDKLRAGLRLLSIVCLVFAALLIAALLMRPLPAQAELQYTQGTLGSVTWNEGKNPHFDIAFEHEGRVYDVDYTLLAPDGRQLLNRIRPGVTARVGYTDTTVGFGTRWRAWELAVDGKMLYELADVKSRTQRQQRGFWIFAGVLLVSGVVMLVVTRSTSRRSRRRF